MIFSDTETLRRRIAKITGRPAPNRLSVIEDTTAFMSIDFGNVLRLNGDDYLVLGNAREGRFGIDDQPKYWVKRCLDLTSGQRKIIKLVFQESFERRVGSTVYHCTRSSKKESDVLHAMEGNPSFMQGKGIRDAAGNLVRIIDIVLGPTFYDYMRRITLSHDAFYHRVFPLEIPLVIDCIEAIADLHSRGLHHGDIRADHILLNNRTGPYVWIDFDYDIDRTEYDVLCLGNILLQAVGKGRHALHDIRQDPSLYPDYRDGLTPEDMSLVFPHRVANLRKVFPHISRELNEILMRFAAGTRDPYRDAATLAADLRSLFPGQAAARAVAPGEKRPITAA